MQELCQSTNVSDTDKAIYLQSNQIAKKMALKGPFLRILLFRIHKFEF